MPFITRIPGRRRAGSAMLLVIIAIATAFVIGLSFLSSSTTTTGTAQTLYRHARARALAESAVALTQQFARNTTDWRTTQPVGSWVINSPLNGGDVSISVTFDPAAADGTVWVSDASFEQSTGELDTPLLSPPMSGTIGGWELQRTALLPTGPTVPRVGVKAVAGAPSGANSAFVAFGTSVSGSATFGQTLATTLAPHTTYELAMDINPGGLSILDTSFGFRVRAGASVIASTQHAATMVLPALPDALPTLPTSPPTSPEVESILSILGMGSGYSRYTLQFNTDGSPASGQLRIELFATSIGVLSELQFDNVSLEMTPNDPLVVMTTGRDGDASHQITAILAPPDMRIVRWLEP